MPRPHWRKMTWVIIIWCALIIIWMVAAGDNSDVNDCDSERTEELRQLCEDATDVGTGIGIAAIGFLGFIGFVALSLIWFMTRPKGRPCPVCGDLVKTGATKCGKCGHDFAAAAGTAGQPAAAQPAAGWYPHPSGEQRYWNGTAWTEDRPPAAAQEAAAQPAAGWYPHPSGEQRYWNGTAWTEDRPPPTQSPPQEPAPP